MIEANFNKKLIELCGTDPKAQCEYLNKFKVKILENTEKNPWKLFDPRRWNKIKAGVYLTIRCGYSGIYQCYNIWDSKENKWVIQVADGSYTIMYKDIYPYLT